MKNKRKSKLREWSTYLPISKKEYFFHILLILDLLLLLLKTSYELYFPNNLNLFIFFFDFIVASIWGIEFIKRIHGREEKFRYIQDRWYHLLGIFPIPIFRFFLFLITLKQSILIYKFIRRGEKNAAIFIDKEINFSFMDLFIDTISDAIFLRSLERVNEVVERLDFSKLSGPILESNRENLKIVVKDSLDNKTSIGKITSNPLFNGLSDQLSNDITNVIIETVENEVIGKISRELNIKLLKEMEKHVKELDLDRITAQTLEEENQGNDILP